MTLKRQSGALMVITPVVITAVVLFTALALDGARLFSLRADMQSQVNAAATAAADASQACGGENISLANMTGRALAAAQAQGFEGDASELVIQPGVVEPSASDPNTLVFRAVSDIAQSNATRVSLSRDEPISRLLPSGMLGDVTLDVNAAARKEVIASISAAGSTATVDEGLLGVLLEGITQEPSLNITDFDSLGDTLFSVGDLLGALGVGSLEDALLNSTADDLAAAIVALAGATSPVGEVADALLGNATSISVSEVLSVLEGAQVPDSAQVRAYDLLISIALNILESSADRVEVDLSTLPLGLGAALPPGLIDPDTITVDIFVENAPSVAIGPARQDENGEWMTAFDEADVSIRVMADAEVNVPFLARATVTLPLVVKLGGGTGALQGADCARGTTNSVDFLVNLSPQVASIGSGDSSDSSDEGEFSTDGSIGVTVDLLTIIPLLPSVLDLQADLDVSVEDATPDTETVEDFELYCPEGEVCPMTAAVSGGGLSGLSVELSLDEASVAGLDLAPLLDPVISPLLQGVGLAVSPLMELLVDPLAQALGLKIGGMQVEIQEASQSGSQLIENIEVVGS
ncbi:hypothetical protein FWJ25_09260 [Marinobacter salinexigens]|uniref:Uncharacterized protein n=1 Tax=Marinobacter salinexigens TaxID=2919747 RepID=A0A5B0VI63_9GAMM|nr:hypothetical protein [Marinobacter salinexigens]KAA1174410.1 hypothetical protein FWJ25_09260 [Marinobacter salinexigens]